MMTNRDIYQKDPATRKLVNEGVANVNDDTSGQALRACLETHLSIMKRFNSMLAMAI